MKINQNDICIVLGTCKKYYQNRFRIQTQTFLNDIDNNNIIICSDSGEQIYGFKTTVTQRKTVLPGLSQSIDTKAFLGQLSIIRQLDFEYFAVICDDTFLDIKYLLNKINQCQLYQGYLYAGMPLMKLVNGYKFKNGFASGGNIRFFNKKSIECLAKYLLDSNDYYSILPNKFQNDFEFNRCDDVVTGYIFEYNNIPLQNIYNDPMVLIMTQTFPNVYDCKKYIENNHQVGYHFLYHSCPLPIQYQNKYFEKMMHYAHKLSKER